ncbi:MAG: hypothetical protein WB729_00900 [Candidatus Sulfotelmatobacter sp.]
MELLLNLVWLLLAIPAYLLWRNASRAQHSSVNSLHCLFALGCALILLFPVISATDDLHAMRVEVDEYSKRNVRHVFNDKSCGGQCRWHNLPVVIATSTGIISSTCVWLELPPPPSIPVVASVRPRGSRGPPPCLFNSFARLS